MSVGALTALLLALSAAHAGVSGLGASLLGLAGTSAYLYGTWVVVKLSGAGMTPEGPTRAQVALTVLALLLKIPLIYAGWTVAKGLGPFGPTWFLVALALVYSVVIWRAVLAVRD